MTPEEFIEMVAPAAAICTEHGLYPSVCIAQAALETGWGRNRTLGNNLWGRKHHYGRGIIKATREVVDRQNIYGDATFQHYESIEEGARDYCDLFNNHPKFARVDRTIREAFIDEMGPLYATDAPEEVDGDPSYAEKIHNIIAKWNLAKFDSEEVACQE